MAMTQKRWRARAVVQLFSCTGSWNNTLFKTTFNIITTDEWRSPKRLVFKQLFGTFIPFYIFYLLVSKNSHLLSKKSHFTFISSVLDFCSPNFFARLNFSSPPQTAPASLTQSDGKPVQSCNETDQSAKSVSARGMGGKNKTQFSNSFIL